MDKFKEFQGRDLDECIREACAYFDAPREKLEVEIIQDAKSGIFGIVLARKALIRARRAHLDDAVLGLLGTAPTHAPMAQREKKTRKSQRPVAEKAAPPSRQAPVKPAAERSAAKTLASPQSAPIKNEAKGQPEPQTDLSACVAADEHDTPEGFDTRPLEELNGEKLAAVAGEAVSRLIMPIAGHEVPVSIQIGAGNIRARVDWEGDAGLLIGREGQTLAAVQYLASRMVSRAMNNAVRIQLDIGDYRSRQDEKLRDLAKNLADRARQTGRSYSTRPLSSYHRRIIHLSLQDEPDIITRSSGDGAMKRVLISPRRSPEHA